MKLTKLQRHTAYIILLKEFEEVYCDWWGLCFVWDEVFGIKIYKSIKKVLPEYCSKRTRNDKSVLFFKSTEERRKALIECINETA